MKHVTFKWGPCFRTIEKPGEDEGQELHKYFIKWLRNVAVFGATVTYVHCYKIKI